VREAGDSNLAQPDLQVTDVGVGPLLFDRGLPGFREHITVGGDVVTKGHTEPRSAQQPPKRCLHPPNMTTVKMATAQTQPIGAPFLELPAKLRLQIYAAADIIGQHTESPFINLGKRGAIIRTQRADTHARGRISVTYALLLSCRTIYQKVSALVYGEHHFFDATARFKALLSEY